MAYGKARYWVVMIWLWLFLPRFAIASDCFKEVGSDVDLVGCTNAEIVLQTPHDSYELKIVESTRLPANKAIAFTFGDCKLEGQFTVNVGSGSNYMTLDGKSVNLPATVSVNEHEATFTSGGTSFGSSCTPEFTSIGDGNFKTTLGVKGEGGAYLTITATDAKIHSSTYNVLGMPAWALALLIVAIFVFLVVAVACLVYWIWLRKRLALRAAPLKEKPKPNVEPPAVPLKTGAPQSVVVPQSVVMPKVEEVQEPRKKKTVSIEQPSMEKAIPEEPIKIAPRKKPSKSSTTKSHKTPVTKSRKKFSTKLHKKKSGKKVVASKTKTRTQDSDEKTARVELPSFEKTWSIYEMLKSQKTQSDESIEQDDGKSADEQVTVEAAPLQEFAASPPYFTQELLNLSVAKHPILVKLLKMDSARRRHEIYFKADPKEVQAQASEALMEIKRGGDADVKTVELIRELEAIKSIAEEIELFKAASDKTVFDFPWSFVAIGEILSLPVKSLEEAIYLELPTDGQCHRIIRECKRVESELKQKKNLPANTIAQLEERIKLLREELVVPVPMGEIRPPDDFFIK